MKTIRIILSVSIFFLFGMLNSQENKTEKVKLSKEAYYENRAKEDAKFEQQFRPKSKKEERKFWKEQKSYEKDLKERDEEAYEAYMQGKRDAYREYRNHCNNNCHHSHYYHSQTSFYYRYEYYRQPRYSSGTSIRVGTPRIRIGF